MAGNPRVALKRPAATAGSSKKTQLPPPKTQVPRRGLASKRPAAAGQPELRKPQTSEKKAAGAKSLAAKRQVGKTDRPTSRKRPASVVLGLAAAPSSSASSGRRPCFKRPAGAPKRQAKTSAKRAFGATSFAKERKLVLDRANTLREHSVASLLELEVVWEELDDAYHEASQELLKDKQVALACVTAFGPWLEVFHETLRDDAEVVQTALDGEQGGCGAYKAASVRLRQNKALALLAVQQDGLALEYASEALRGDFEVVSEALDSSPFALRYASRALLSDKRLVRKAVLKFGSLLGDVEADLRADKGIVLDAVGNDGDALQYASEALRNDPAVVLAAVKQTGLALQWASESLQASEDAVLEAVKRQGMALRCASKDLRARRDLVLEAVKHDGGALEFASEELRGDREVVLEAVKRHGPALEFACEQLRGDGEVVLEAVKARWYALSFANGDLRGDKGFVLEAVRASGLALRFASGDIQSDRDVVTEAVKSHGSAIRSAAAALKGDKDLLVLAMRHTSSWLAPDHYHEASEELKKAITFDAFDAAAHSVLAVPGEEAPVLSLSLEHSSSHDGHLNTDVGPNDAKGHFFCQVTLLSGASFSCSLPDLPLLLGTSNTRPGPILETLAKKVIEELPQHTEVKSPNRIFIVFVTDSGDSIPTTVWDWDRPLNEFLTSPNKST